MDQAARVFQLAPKTFEMKPLFFFLTAVGLCTAAELPPKAQPGQGGLLSADYIYPLENRPRPQCHASTLAETKTGLVAAWFAGTREKHHDVGIHVSRLVAGQWTALVEVAAGAEIRIIPAGIRCSFNRRPGRCCCFTKSAPLPAHGGE